MLLVLQSSSGPLLGPEAARSGDPNSLDPGGASVTLRARATGALSVEAPDHHCGELLRSKGGLLADIFQGAPCSISTFYWGVSPSRDTACGIPSASFPSHVIAVVALPLHLNFRVDHRIPKVLGQGWLISLPWRHFRGGKVTVMMESDGPGLQGVLVAQCMMRPIQARWGRLPRLCRRMVKQRGAVE
jgi:hypothetical protein